MHSVTITVARASMRGHELVSSVMVEVAPRQGTFAHQILRTVTMLPLLAWTGPSEATP